MKFAVHDLEGFCSSLLKTLGASEERAALVSESMILANLRGIDSHGIRRLPIYVQRIEKGLLDPEGEIILAQNGEATAVIDGGLTFGEVVGRAACDLAKEKAVQYGTGVVLCRNTNHFGMAAWYGLYLSDHDMIGIIMSNANASIAPWGGSRSLFGTNPLCITIPAKTRPHIVLDMAMSIVARGKIRAAQEKGEKIPDTWAVGPDGNPTDDPAEAIKGSLLPIGGPKGYCLALIIDILSGMLSCAHCSTEIRSMFDLSGPSGMGHYFQAIDVGKFLLPHTFKEKIDAYIDHVKNSPKNEGVKEIFLPGELEYLSTVRKEKEGIDLPAEVVASLRKIERTHGTTHVFSSR